jgi:hypothetical protein
MIIFRKSSIHSYYCISDFAKCSRAKNLSSMHLETSFQCYVVSYKWLVINFVNLKFFNACKISLPVSQYEHRLSVTKTSWLLYLIEIVAFDCDICPTETNSPQNAKYHMLMVFIHTGTVIWCFHMCKRGAVQIRAWESEKPAVLALSNNGNPLSNTFQFIPFFFWRNLLSCDTLFV